MLILKQTKYILSLFYHKDGLSVIALLAILTYFIGFIPNYLGHPDNYIMANPDSTPEHIVPEWYFLPFYAILRSILINY